MQVAQAGMRGEAAGRLSVTGRQNRHEGEQELARAGEPQHKLGPGQRRERASQQGNSSEPLSRQKPKLKSKSQKPSAERQVPKKTQKA